MGLLGNFSLYLFIFFNDPLKGVYRRLNLSLTTCTISMAHLIQFKTSSDNLKVMFGVKNPLIPKGDGWEVYGNGWELYGIWLDLR